MAKYISLVLTNAVPGRDEEFNKWYTEEHLPDVLAVPGITAATRLCRVADSADPHFGRFRYMTVYELETDDLRGLFRILVARMGTAMMPMSSTLEPEMAFYDWEILAPRLIAKSAADHVKGQVVGLPISQEESR